MSTGDRTALIIGFAGPVGVITLLGAAFLICLSFEGFKMRGVGATYEDDQPRSIRKGFMANLLNAHPYLFWFVIGAPTLLKAWATSVLTADDDVCLLGAYVALVAVPRYGLVMDLDL